MIDSVDPLTLEEIRPLAIKEFAFAAPQEIRRVLIRHTEKGIVVVFEIGTDQRILSQQNRRGVRFFQSIDGAAAVLRQNGVLQWTADMTGWIPRTILRAEKVDAEKALKTRRRLRRMS